MKIFEASRPPGMPQEEFEDALSILRASPYPTTVLVKYPSGEYVLSVGTYCYQSNKQQGEAWKCLVEAKSYSVYQNYQEIPEDDDWQSDFGERSPFGESTLPVRYKNEVNV